MSRGEMYSEKIHTECNLIFKSLDSFGEHPAMIIAVLSANILFSLDRGEKTVKKILMWVINGVLMLLCGYMMVMRVVVRMFEAKLSRAQSIISLLCTIIIIVIIQVLLRKVSYERLNEFRRAAIIGAHFPSDVLFGGFIAIFSICINSCIFKEKIIEKKLKNKLKSKVLLNH
jgi:hypothetical protein